MNTPTPLGPTAHEIEVECQEEKVRDSIAASAGSPDRLARVKAAVGIACANCSTCVCLGSDNDGGEPEYSVSWAVCEKKESYQYLKSFPFKKEMPCWEPEFWASKFADLIKEGSMEEMDAAFKSFAIARDAAENNKVTNPTP